MIILSNITKNYKVGIFAMFIAAALVGSVVAFGDNYAYAGRTPAPPAQGAAGFSGARRAPDFGRPARPPRSSRRE